MMLTEHFSLEQLIQPEAKIFQSYSNQLTQEAFVNLGHLARTLEYVRHLLHTELLILSAYRDDELNQAMSTQDPDSHRQGLAADFITPPLPILAAFHKLAESDLVFDHLINEWGWIHLSITNDGSGRRMIQTLLNNKTLLNGMTT